MGYLGEELKINLKAPPVDGKANRALLQFLARALALKPRDLVLLAGGTGRSKIVQITGLEASEIDSRLNLNQTKQILPKP